MSMHVLLRVAAWSMDATHLGRDEDRSAVQGEVICEVASSRTIGLSARPQATGEDVVRLLEATRIERSGRPLPFMSGNGIAYVSEAVAAWCKKSGVLLLRSLPRTPQHNAASEHGVYGLKLNSGLDDGGAVVVCEDALARLSSARTRIDNNSMRQSRG